MTVTSHDNKIVYQCDGVKTVFPFPYILIDSTDLVVSLFKISDGTVTQLTITTHYTVSNPPYGNGATITLLTAPASTYYLVIERIMPLTQDLSYAVADEFPSKDHEGAIDKIILILQQLRSLAGRAITTDLSKTTAPTFPNPPADPTIPTYIGYDGSGNLVNITNLHPATHFGVTFGGDSINGTSFTMTISALDANGNIDTEYNGSVTISHNGMGLLDISSATLVAGTVTISAIYKHPKTTEDLTISITDGTLTGDATITTHGYHVVVSLSSTVYDEAGINIGNLYCPTYPTWTVTVKRYDGTTATDYTTGAASYYKTIKISPEFGTLSAGSSVTITAGVGTFTNAQYISSTTNPLTYHTDMNVNFYGQEATGTKYMDIYNTSIPVVYVYGTLTHPVTSTGTWTGTATFYTSAGVATMVQTIPAAPSYALYRAEDSAYQGVLPVNGVYTSSSFALANPGGHGFVTTNYTFKVKDTNGVEQTFIVTKV